jgi:hypothetical protein
MNMSALVSLSADAMREHAAHASTVCPVASRVERRWAGVACAAFVALALLLVVAS